MNWDLKSKKVRSGFQRYTSLPHLLEFVLFDSYSTIIIIKMSKCCMIKNKSNNDELCDRKAAAVLAKHPSKITSGDEAKKLVIHSSKIFLYIPAKE